MREVAIAGVGLHKFGRFEDKTFEQLGQEAVLMALKDANNMPWKDIQAVYCGTMHGGTVAGHRVVQGIGLTGIPIINLETACVSGATALMLAYQGIASGFYDVALALGVEKMPRGFMRMTSFPHWQMLSGLHINPLIFALRATRHMAEYGTTHEQLAKVSVKNHKHGVLNPYALYQKELTMEEVLNSVMVCYPLRLLMLCAPDEGAAAVILCSNDIAEKYTEKPVTVAAVCTGVSPYGSSMAGAGMGYTGLSAKVHNPEIASTLAKQAYEISGIGPEDLDLVELQDTDAASEIIFTEELGLCKPGEGGRLLDEGRTAAGGDIPVNISGGLQSKGEPTGASALGQIVEVTWQLRSEAGPRQVSGAKVGLCHVEGAGGNSGVTILKR
ncbi:thiolase family protein [Chloroflexota bacterium]